MREEFGMMRMESNWRFYGRRRAEWQKRLLVFFCQAAHILVHATLKEEEETPALYSIGYPYNYRPTPLFRPRHKK